MKKLIAVLVVAGIIFVMVINPTFIVNQTMDWAKANPKSENAPETLYYVGRGCDLTGSGDKAILLFELLYQQYPQRGDLCAPALYYCGRIRAEGSYVRAYRLQALQYLDIVVSQYSDQTEWVTKSKQLINEVNYEHN